ncbi:uncharacterized protein LOC107435276 isoform X9 [Ziziphus jujuba]|uniref:Uncharacterized protein LOC107435276 isoform X9 n=1 Tax=Ziziphus jujuba TaxID=326968 RepID=A0ABM3I220_ZIZJJ|nr:uncharacterized protein LOC107435276 isoform X9 [Ziziphus jujuba]
MEGAWDSVHGTSQKTLWSLWRCCLLLSFSPGRLMVGISLMNCVHVKSLYIQYQSIYVVGRSTMSGGASHYILLLLCFFTGYTHLFLFQPLTIYHATKVVGLGSWASQISKQLQIHYLGPEKELQQLAVFAELHALFPDVHVHMELIGPAIPQSRDGEKIDLCKYAHCLRTDCFCKSSSNTWGSNSSENLAITLQLRRGFYHDRYKDIAKESSPHFIIAPNAGIAAYSSWLPTMELIKELGVPAVFSDYCEEACHLGAGCISSVTGSTLNLPIQLNPFRQPMVVEDSALLLPCYSNCFLYGI